MYSRRGWHRGLRSWRGSMSVPEGYVYIGPCRCGFGPDAYYQEIKTGRIVPAHQLLGHRFWSTYEKEDLETELEALKAEKNRLEKRIEELEKMVKEEK